MKIGPNRQCSNGPYPKDLFEAADARERWLRAPRTAKRLAQRHGLSPAQALLLADLNGWGDDE